MGLNDFVNTTKCLDCSWTPRYNSSSVQMARLAALRHWEETGHPNFEVTRHAEEKITFPLGLMNPFLKQCHDMAMIHKESHA